MLLQNPSGKFWISVKKITLFATVKIEKKGLIGMLAHKQDGGGRIKKGKKSGKKKLKTREER